MRLTVIGSGTIIPQANRRPSAYLLRSGSDCVLLDMGPGTLHQLASQGVEPKDIDAVLVTHLHLDHAIDTLHLLAQRSIAARSERREGLRIIGPPGFRAELQAWVRAVNPGILDENRDVVWEEMGGASTQVGPWTVHAVSVNHRNSGASGALGYHLESDEGVLSYTGDSSLCQGLNRLLDHRGCLLCECTSPDRDPQMGHLTPSQVRRLAQRNPPQLLLLTHIGPAFGRNELPGEAFVGYPGRVDVATDGLVVSFDSNYIHTYIEG